MNKELLVSRETRTRKDRRKITGTQGELYAVDHLKSASYDIVELNWRCKSGEIDIIAQTGQVLIFIEVRTRSVKGIFGTPQESVNRIKQAKVKANANVYLYQYKKYHMTPRFDVIAVYLDDDGNLEKLQHIIHAF